MYTPIDGNNFSFAKMDKSIWVLFLAIHFVNCNCAGDDNHHHISPVDDNNIKVTALPDFANNFLFAAVWDSKTQSGYATDFVSLPGANSIFRFDYKAQQLYAATIEGETSPAFIWPVEGCDNEFVVGLNGVMKLLRWDGVSPTATIIRSILTTHGHIDYLLPDRSGHLFFGTINSSSFCSANNEYSMYRYTKGKITTLFGGIKTSTGLAIDYNQNKFYHTDACRYQILEFDYDPRNGNICNGRVVFDFKKAGVTLSQYNLGLKVDTIGRLYATMYGTGRMWIIDPKKSRILNTVYFPSPGVSDLVFGGPKLDELYVVASRLIINGYGGNILENRTQDRVFFKVEGLNARGYDNGRIRLGHEYNCH